MADMTPEIPPCGFSLQLSPGTKFLTVTELLDKTASAIHPYRAGEEEEVFSTQCENPPGRIPIDSSKLDQIPIRPFKRAVTRQEHEKRLLEAIEQGRITLLNPITFTPLKPVPSKLSEKRDEVVPLEQFILFARTLRIEVVVEEPSTDPQALAQENERLKARLAKIESTGPGPPLTSRERDNLYRMIGGVVLLIMESKAGRRFGRETKVNRAVLLTELDRVLTTVEARTEGISKGRAP